MKKQLFLIALLILPLCLKAQEEELGTAVQQQLGSARELVRKSGAGVYTGFSGGMMLHIGYMFSDDPRKIFSNAGLGNEEYVKNLPKDGVSLGLGGTLRVHLLNHIHVGAEGGMSIMPLRGHGNIRIGYGGALCDGYLNLGKTRPLLGLSLGGGVMKQEQMFPLVRKKVLANIAGYLDTPELADIDNYIVPNSLNEMQGILGCVELGRRALVAAQA